MACQSFRYDPSFAEAGVRPGSVFYAVAYAGPIGREQHLDTAALAA